MNRILTPLAGSALLALAGCGGSNDASPTENTAGRLDNAAEQSDAAAAEILESASDRAAAANSGAEANAIADQALNQAGNAQ